MINFFKRSRKKINQQLTSIEARRFFSPALLVHYQAVRKVLQEYLHGKIIDLGCGNMPYRKLIERVASEYHGLDIEARTSGVKYITDVQKMDSVGSGSYDGAVSFELLEHVPSPPDALKEMYRILKPGGMLVISVPHLSRLHEVPSDYYRFTKYGLKYLLTTAGFKVESISEVGGIFCFLGHQWSTLLVLTFWNIPIVGKLIFWLNSWLCVKPAVIMDRLLRTEKFFPLGYLGIAIKESK